MSEEKEELRPTMELRLYKRLVIGIEKNHILQQKHEVYVVGISGDGCDGGDTWEEMVPSGDFEWVDVPVVVE